MIFKKDDKTEEKLPPEPQHYLSATNVPTYNYKVYYMSKKEKIIYSAIAFVIGAVIGYLFYGGIGKDDYGNPTILTWILNIAIPALVGFIFAKIFIPMRTKQIIDKQQRVLRKQFRDFLETITTSLGAGNNVVSAFQSAHDDLGTQYDEGSYILNELKIILDGLNNNIAIEDMLMDFGERSGVRDICNFATVFQVCYRKGGNIREVIAKTHAVISKKMEINEEIETMVSGSKMNQYILLVMPIILITLIKTMSPEFSGNFVTPTGIASTTVAIGCFVGAYLFGQKIMNIKL